MSLSGYQNINNTVRYGSEGFDFAGTLGDFIGNAEFSYGNEDYKQDVSAIKSGAYAVPNARSNIWHALSAIGQEIGEVTYANVKNYIDIVSNIDMCKTKSLMSMMKNVDMDYTVIKDIDDFPIEVLNLIDIFSIDKKYLLDNDKIKDDLIEDLVDHAVINGQTGQDISNQDYYRRFGNGFLISAANPAGRGQLVLVTDNGYDEKDINKKYGSIQDLAADRDIYDVNYGFVTYRKYQMLSGADELSCEIRKFSVPSFDKGNYTPITEGYALISAGSVICSVETDVFENAVTPGGDGAFPFEQVRPDIMVKYIFQQNDGQENRFKIGIDQIDEKRYSEYIKSVFTELLSSYLDMRYNITAEDIKVDEIYPIRYYI